MSLRTLLATVLICSLAACGGGGKDGDKPSDSGGSKKKVLYFMRQEAWKSLDPVKQFDQSSSDMVSNLHDSLLQYHYLKRPYEMVPNLLVKLPELSEDGLTYTFELRTDVRFHDDPCFPGGKGRLLNSDDVIYSLKRFADARLNILSYPLWQGAVAGMDEFRKQTAAGADINKVEISGIKKIDAHKLTITFTSKNPLALFPLAAPQTSIVAREAVEKYGEDFQHHPVGTGPFRAKTLDRRGVTVLERHPHYHGVYPSEGEPSDEAAGLLAAKGVKIPIVDEVHLPLIEEPQPATLRFLSGKMDWVALDRDNFAKMGFKDDKGYHLKPEFAAKYDIYGVQELMIEFWAFNMNDKLIGKNKALRQAIAYALDMKGYLEKLEQGRGITTKTVVPPDIKGSERDVPAEWYTQDIEMAKKKLAEAGYPGGKGLPPLVIEYRAATSQTRQNFEWHRNELAKIGIVAQANFQTFSAFLKRIESGNFQVGVFGWGADYPDAENFYQLNYGPNKAPGPNHGSFSNKEYDALFEQSRFMENGPERYALFAKMNALLKDEVPMIYTHSRAAVGLRQKWVKNFKRNVMVDTLSFRHVDIDTAAQAKGLPGAK